MYTSFKGCSVLVTLLVAMTKYLEWQLNEKKCILACGEGTTVCRGGEGVVAGALPVAAETQRTACYIPVDREAE